MKAKGRLPLELRAAYLALHRCSDVQFGQVGVTADQFVYRQVRKAGQAIRDQMVSSLSAAETESLVTLWRRVSESSADASMVMAAASTQNGN